MVFPILHRRNPTRLEIVKTSPITTSTIHFSLNVNRAVKNRQTWEWNVLETATDSTGLCKLWHKIVDRDMFLPRPRGMLSAPPRRSVSPPWRTWCFPPAGRTRTSRLTPPRHWCSSTSADLPWSDLWCSSQSRSPWTAGEWSLRSCLWNCLRTNRTGGMLRKGLELISIIWSVLSTNQSQGSEEEMEEGDHRMFDSPGILNRSKIS